MDGYTLTTSAEKPDRIVKAFDWLLSDSAWDEVKYGPEGLTYNVVDGEKVPTEEYDTPKWNGVLLRRNNDPSFFINLKTPKEEKEVVEKWIGRAMDTFVFSEERGYLPPVTKEPKYIDAKDELEQTITKIIVNDLPVSAYDEALDKFYKNGGEEYIKQMNEYLNK